MKKNKTNLEKLIKGRNKINPPGLDYFIENIVYPYYPRMKTISMIDYADRIFSEFVRLSEANDQGMVQCITCGERFFRTKIQNGHYKKRSSYKYRFSTANCHGQCPKCNLFLCGNYRNYHIRMVKTYGEEIERKIWEDNSTQKLLDYDLIQNCVERHKKNQEKLKIIEQNTR